MKFAAILTLLGTGNLYACPDLKGTYASCLDQDGKVAATNVVITQKREIFTMIYTVESTRASNERSTEIVRTDGKVKTETAEGTGITAQSKAYCSGSKLVEETKYFYQGQEGASSHSETVKNGSQMIITTTETLLGESMVTTVTCQ